MEPTVNLVVLIVVGILLIVSIAINILLYRQKNKIHSSQKDMAILKEENSKLKEENSKLKEVVKKGDEFIDAAKIYLQRLDGIISNIPKFNNKDSLRDRLDRLAGFWDAEYFGEKVFVKNSPGCEKLFQDLYKKLEASEFINSLRTQVTRPFAQLLARREPEPTATELCDEFLKMAIRLYDSIHSFQNEGSPIDLELNAKFVKGYKSEDAIYEEAKFFTDIVEDAPIWSQRLAKCLKALGADRLKIVFSGYKFHENNMPCEDGVDNQECDQH